MKKYLYIVLAAIAVLSSCSKDKDFEQDKKSGGITSFTAIIVNESPTRTTLIDNTPNWDKGDVISVDGNEYTANQAGTTSTFTGNGATGPTYHAYFPANLYKGGAAALPATQTYAEGKFNMPMYAYSETTELTFKNICAVLAIKVTSDDIAQLKSIKVSSDKAMYGEISIVDNVAVLKSSTDATKAVELVCNTAVELNTDGTTFYISIPAQTYKFLNIYLSEDGTTYKQAMATKVASGIGSISCNTIFNIDYKTNAIQLWENGPLFAEYNVGITEDYPNGSYYYWGGSINAVGVEASDRDGYKGEEYTLPSEFDTATKLWGSNWRMPTSDEFSSLIDNSKDRKCNMTWETNYNNSGVDGALFTGLSGTAYGNNSVFFPCDDAVHYDKLCGYSNLGKYWSSTRCNAQIAYNMCLYDGSCSVGSEAPNNWGCNVRAVLK